MQTTSFKDSRMPQFYDEVYVEIRTSENVLSVRCYSKSIQQSYKVNSTKSILKSQSINLKLNSYSYNFFLAQSNLLVLERIKSIY